MTCQYYTYCVESLPYNSLFNTTEMIMSLNKPINMNAAVGLIVKAAIIEN